MGGAALGNNECPAHIRDVPDTELQIIRQQVSEQKMRVLKQHTAVLGKKREGGQKLETETLLLETLRDELAVMERRLERLVREA